MSLSLNSTYEFLPPPQVYLLDIAMPPQYKKAIETSLQVNRQIFKEEPDHSFMNFVGQRLIARQKPSPVDPLANWLPKLSKDYAFCKKYNVPERTMRFDKDEIVLGIQPTAKFY